MPQKFQLFTNPRFFFGVFGNFPTALRIHRRNLHGWGRKKSARYHPGSGDRRGLVHERLLRRILGVQIDAVSLGFLCKKKTGGHPFFKGEKKNMSKWKWTFFVPKNLRKIDDFHQPGEIDGM